MFRCIHSTHNAPRTQNQRRVAALFIRNELCIRNARAVHCTPQPNWAKNCCVFFLSSFNKGPQMHRQINSLLRMICPKKRIETAATVSQDDPHNEGTREKKCKKKHWTSSNRTRCMHTARSHTHSIDRRMAQFSRGSVVDSIESNPFVAARQSRCFVFELNYDDECDFMDCVRREWREKTQHQIERKSSI